MEQVAQTELIAKLLDAAAFMAEAKEYVESIESNDDLLKSLRKLSDAQIRIFETLRFLIGQVTP